MVFKGFNLSPNLDKCLKKAASNEFESRYESDIVRDALVDYLTKRHPKLVKEFKVV